MTSARIQLVLLALTLGIAAGGLFIPAPRRAAEPVLSLLAADGAGRLTRDLARAHLGADGAADVRTRSSALLPSAVRLGPRPDVIVAANHSDAVAKLTRDGVISDSGAPMLTLPLVVIQPRDRPVPATPLLALTGSRTRRIAIASNQTDSGRITREALENVGLWYRLLEHGRLHLCASAGAVVAMVRRGDADAGIVLGPDAAGESNVAILRDAFPNNTYTPIEFRAHVVSGAPHPDRATAFVRWLEGDSSRALIDAFEVGALPVIRIAPSARSVIDPLLLSVRAACLSVMLVFPLAILLGAFLAGRRAWWARILAGILDLPLVLPPVAVGLGMLLLLSRNGPIHRLTGIEFAFSWQAGALAAGVVALPLALRPIRRAIEGIDRRHRMVAESLGVSAVTRVLLVHLPLGTRGVLAGLLLSFARAFGEFGATLVVAGSLGWTTRTMSGALFAEFQEGADVAWWLLAVACAVALFCTVTAQWIERRPEYRFVTAASTAPAFDIDITVDYRDTSIGARITGDESLALIVGEPRSGKTALIETLAGFRRPRTGWVRVGGRILADAAGRTHVPAARRNVGFVPIGGALFPHLTVEENLAFGVRRVDDAVVRRIETVIERFALAPILRRRPRDLAPADRLHAAIARAIAPGPTWLLVDGPDRLITAEALPNLLRTIADIGPPAIVACDAPARPTDPIPGDWPQVRVTRAD